MIIDDHRLFADGLSLILTQLDSSLRIDTHYNARSMLDNFDFLKTYDLVLIDLDMPNLNGFDFLTAIKHRQHKLAVLVVSASENLSDVEQILRLGAKGFAPKSLPPHEMLVAIKRVLSDKRYLPRHIAETVDWLACENNSNLHNKHIKPETADLRVRQIEVLTLMRDGHKNNQIGLILGISESAVKSHISKIFNVLKTRNRTSAVKIAMDLNII